MFNKQKEPSKLDKAIDSIYEEMASVNADSQEYAAMVKQLSKLQKMKTQEKSNRRPTPDTVMIVVANLAGIAMIIGHERGHVITTKALGFITRMR